MTTNDFINLLKIGGPFCAIFVLWILRVIVTGKELEEMREQRDEWKKTAEVNQKIAEAVLDQGGAARDLFAAMKNITLEAGKTPK